MHAADRQTDRWKHTKAERPNNRNLAAKYTASRGLCHHIICTAVHFFKIPFLCRQCSLLKYRVCSECYITSKPKAWSIPGAVCFETECCDAVTLRGLGPTACLTFCAVLPTVQIFPHSRPFLAHDKAYTCYSTTELCTLTRRNEVRNTWGPCLSTRIWSLASRPRYPGSFLG